MIYNIAYIIIFISILLTIGRLIVGPNAVDRIIATDLITTFLGCLLIIYILEMGEIIFLDFILVLTLMSFFGTIMYSRYLEKTIKKADQND